MFGPALPQHLLCYHHQVPHHPSFTFPQPFLSIVHLQAQQALSQVHHNLSPPLIHRKPSQAQRALYPAHQSIPTPNPPESIPSPPESVPSSPGFLPSPTIYIPSPPYFEPSPPSSVPSPIGFQPSPPVFLPPIVFPLPTTPPSPRRGPMATLWCVAKPSVVRG
ncbi:hypothetical protein ACFX1X_004401 [Malus domestica]|uniref:Uncharacterized protein n=1 Tax=Malus domestica TaxID=3750 RepID=A0A498IY92_MALDO|nr:hypothetical protein DVH24_021935 [Malus domestica]